MNLGKTWIGYILKKSNKMGKEGIFGIKIKYKSLLKKKSCLKKKTFFHFNLIKEIKKPKKHAIFLI